MATLKRDKQGNLVKEYPGLQITLTGPLAEEVKGIDPAYISLSIYDDSVSLWVSLYKTLRTDEYRTEMKKGPDAPTSEALTRTTYPSKAVVDTANVVSSTEIVKEGDAA